MHLDIAESAANVKHILEEVQQQCGELNSVIIISMLLWFLMHCYEEYIF